MLDRIERGCSVFEVRTPSSPSTAAARAISPPPLPVSPAHPLLTWQAGFSVPHRGAQQPAATAFSSAAEAGAQALAPLNPMSSPPPQTPACPAILPRNLPAARSPRARGASQVDRARGGNKTVALDRSAFFCWGFLQISPVWGDWRAHAPGGGVRASGGRLFLRFWALSMCLACVSRARV